MEVAILAQVVFSWSLLVVSENYLSVEAMLQSPPVLSRARALLPHREK